MNNKFSIAKIILKKNNTVGILKLPDFRTYYKATAMKTLWCWHKDGHTDQWHRAESPETDHHICGRMIPTRAPGPRNRERTVSPTSGAATLDVHVQKNEGGRLPNTIHTINTKRDQGPPRRS